MTVRPATEEDLERIEGLLRSNDLPHRDVGDSPGRFLVGLVDDGVVTAAGVEAYGSDGLLRSVVVEESVRGRGYGTALCREIEADAREAGIETLYLLTTAASAFFGRRGFEAIDRTDAPEAIRHTAEFESLCPATATCMRKALE